MLTKKPKTQTSVTELIEMYEQQGSSSSFQACWFKEVPMGALTAGKAIIVGRRIGIKTILSWQRISNISLYFWFYFF